MDLEALLEALNAKVKEFVSAVEKWGQAEDELEALKTVSESAGEEWESAEKEWKSTPEDPVADSEVDRTLETMQAAAGDVAKATWPRNEAAEEVLAKSEELKTAVEEVVKAVAEASAQDGSGS